MLTAMLVCLGVAFAATAIAGKHGGSDDKTKYVDTSADMKYQDNGDGPYGEDDNFHGHVHGHHGCKKHRHVVIKNTDTNSKFGKTETNRHGYFEVDAGSGAPSGHYKAKVKKKTIHKRHKDIVCKKGHSNRVLVP